MPKLIEPGDCFLVAVCDKCDAHVEFRHGAGSAMPEFMYDQVIATIPDGVHLCWDSEFTVADHRRVCGGTFHRAKNLH